MIGADDLRAVRVEAARSTVSRPGMYDDALQEGLVGWWQATETRPGDARYAYGAARQRIAGFVTEKARPFGAPPRQGRRQADERLLFEDESLDRTCGADVESAAIAYHRPEIRAAVARLTPRQRAIVEKVALGDTLTSAQRSEWSCRLRPRLAEELAHLKGMFE